MLPLLSGRQPTLEVATSGGAPSFEQSHRAKAREISFATDRGCASQRPGSDSELK